MYDSIWKAVNTHNIVMEKTSNILNMAELSSPQVKTSPRQLRIPRSGQGMICRLVLVQLTAMRTSGLCTLYITK